MRPLPPLPLPPELPPLLAGAVPDAALAAAMAHGWAAAPYLRGLMRRRAATLRQIVTDGFDAALASAMARAAGGGDGDGDVDARLRRAKADVALIVALADLAGDWPLERVTAVLSDFADLALDAATAAALAERGAGNAGFSVLALGKLGSRELNYSSDVDLILLYDPAAIPLRPREDHSEAAVRIARRIVAIMEAPTADGYVFRTDLRLRPSWEATPIALPFGAAEQYYQSEALTWERVAFIRARAAAGDIARGAAFLTAIAPFVWRRSLDYTAIRDIQAVSLRIRDQAGDGGSPVGPGYDLKRGRGGIREAEFYAQIHQLIWGGRDAGLRAPATLDALAALAAGGRIDPAAAAAIAAAYRLLRSVEHRLQMRADAQTHSVPADAAQRAAVAALCGYPGWPALAAALQAASAAVAAAYDRLLADAGGEHVPGEAAAASRWLTAAGLDAAAAPLVERWRSRRYRALRSDEARHAFEAVLPGLLRALGGSGNPGQALARLDGFLEQLPSGAQFFALLAANPPLVALLARLLGVTPVLADALARTPALFDVLLGGDVAGGFPDGAALAAELASVLHGARAFEERLDRVRRWTGERRFQLGALLIDRRIDPLAAARRLSDLADAGLAELYGAVTAEFAVQHGVVAGGELVVLAMGRYGGRSLTHASDLDLIYLFTGSHDAVSDGARPLAATTYFNRLAGRLSAALSVPTAAGALYEVDTRLRPSGAQGLLAVSVASFADYQRAAAWTWEHLALTRARVVAGPDTEVAAAVAGVLAMPRDPARLRADVLAMRADIDAAKPGQGAWDVKLGRGGLVDIEFIVHFLQLRHQAGFSPELGVALAALAAAGLLPGGGAGPGSLLHVPPRSPLRGGGGASKRAAPSPHVSAANVERGGPGWGGPQGASPEPPGLLAAHDLMTRLLVLLRLVVPDTSGRVGALPLAVTALLAAATGHADSAALEAALGLAKATVIGAWEAVFDRKR